MDHINIKGRVQYMKNLDITFLQNVSELLEQARKNVKTSVNLSMVYTYYEIGKRIVQEEQNGQERADYGKYLIKKLSEYYQNNLAKDFLLQT